MGDNVYKLTAGSDNLNLSYRNKSSDDLTHTFNFDQDGVTSDAKKNGTPLTLDLISSNSGDNAKSIYGVPAVAPPSVADNAPPRIALDHNGNPKVRYNAMSNRIVIEFEEAIRDNASYYGFSLKDGNGNFVPMQYDTSSGKTLALKRNFNYTTEVKFPNGYSTLTLTRTRDLAGNEGKDYAPVDLPELKLTGKAAPAGNPLYMESGNNIDKFSFSFTMPITADSLNPLNFSFIYNGAAQNISSVNIGPNGETLEFEIDTAYDIYSTDEIALIINSSAGIRDAANGGDPISGTFYAKPQ